MTPNQQREEFSKAYVAAVAARAGCKLASWSQDSGCLDVTVGTHSGFEGTLAAPKLDLQLRSSSKPKIETATHVRWKLTRQHFDILRGRTRTPHILVVVLLPEDSQAWLEQTPEQLIMRRCAYWVHLLGQPEIPSGGSTVVDVPKSQLFSPDALLSLLERVSRNDGRERALEGQS